MKIMIAVLLALLCFAPDDPPPPAKDNIRVGVILSTTGPLAAFGQDTKNGVELAVKVINDAGGIEGRKLEIVFYDACSKPEEARVGASKLAEHEGVVAVIGCVASSLSLNAAPVLQKAGIPMISPSSTNPTVTEQGDMIFRACFMEEFQGSALAWYTINDIKVEKAAILTNRDDPYSTGLGKYFKEKFVALRGSVVAEESFTQGTVKYEIQLANIKKSGAEVLFLPVYHNDVALIAKQAEALDLDVKLLGGDGWESSKLIESAGSALKGAVFGSHYHRGYSDVASEYDKDYRKAFEKAPSSLAALGFDAVMLLQAALMTCADYRGATIAEALNDVKGCELATGKDVEFDENRNARKPLVMVKVGIEDIEFVRAVTVKEVEEAGKNDDD